MLAMPPPMSTPQILADVAYTKLKQIWQDEKKRYRWGVILMRKVMIWVISAGPGVLIDDRA